MVLQVLGICAACFLADRSDEGAEIGIYEIMKASRGQASAFSQCYSYLNVTCSALACI